MRYGNVASGVFLNRPNRFIAEVIIDGKTEVCHVKNTGRCREILTPNTTVYLEKSDNPSRKTAFDLIAAVKGDNLINIDSVAPNKVFGEWAKSCNYFGENPLIKAESTYKNSRFDYYIESPDGNRHFVEVKGVTLENNGVLSFPDAPTLRGIKHINELIESKQDGFIPHIFFIVQMEKCKYFTPNRATHPEFADALVNASRLGVDIKCLNCTVTPDTLDVLGFVPVKL